MQYHSKRRGHKTSLKPNNKTITLLFAKTLRKIIFTTTIITLAMVIVYDRKSFHSKKISAFIFKHTTFFGKWNESVITRM